LSGSNKSFCVLPWIHSFVNNGGEYQVCCTGEEGNNYIIDDDKKPINIKDNPKIEKVMNSKFMMDLRLEMLDGKLPDYCNRCVKTEASGGASRRMIENKHYHNLIDDLKFSTKTDGEIPIKLLNIDYRLGNSCNLICRMCNPKSSKRWVEQIKKLSPDLQEHDYKEDLERYLKINWNTSEVIVNDFKGKSEHVERLHFAGGEPLYSKKMINLLEHCIKLKINNRITLSYNTNLTILPEAVLGLWKEFKEVKLLVSLDGIGQLDDYIRYPSNFNKIHENLNYLDKQHFKYNISEILVSVTVQLNNIFHLDKFLDFLNQFEFVTKIPNFMVLYFPDYLQINCLPKNLTMMASMKINELIKKFEEQDIKDSDFLIQNLLQVKGYLSRQYKEEERVKLFDQFIRFSKEFDNGKSLSLTSVNPEFKSFY
jgi:MoaA/NifB/PqqE/SkfB family radical SAM enzyme